MTARSQLGKSVDLIEEAYEFFLAYAAQGLRNEVGGSPLAGQLRKFLEGTVAAVGDLGDLIGQLAAEENPPASEQLAAFREVVEADAMRAKAALRLVQAQPSVSSQLIDNLNASVHLRALLTDLFLLDEALKLGVGVAPDAAVSESRT
jgi:hypothetical protein